MRPSWVVLPLAVCVVCRLGAGWVSAQQATVATPYHAVGESFFERMGVGWGIGGRGWGLSFGGPNMAVPPFGNFDPAAGANLGAGFGRPGRGGFFNLSAAQGSRRSFTSRTPMITNINGATGFFSDTSLSPFVISYYPVVGGFPTIGVVTPAGLSPAAVQLPALSRVGSLGSLSVPDRAGDCPDFRAAEMGLSPSETPKSRATEVSSADRAAPSVAEARRLHAAEQNARSREAADWFDRGSKAERSGKANVAKIFYEMAARRAGGQLRQKALARLKALEADSKDPPPGSR